MRFLIVLLLLLAPPLTLAESEPGFDERYQRDYNIFNPINQVRPDNPLNPINQVNPDTLFKPLR